MPDPKKMTVKEFRAAGYLQELNRQFLHPLGMALEVVREPGKEERFGLVWDHREDPEGIIYGPDTMEFDKTSRVLAEQAEKAVTRLTKLGYVIQPYKE